MQRAGERADHLLEERHAAPLAHQRPHACYNRQPRIAVDLGGGELMETSTRKRVRPIDVMLAPLRLLERSRGWRRRWLIVAYACLLLVAGFFVWWGTSLNDLPDVGDPFDVEAFVDASRVPESEDAFVLYRKAAGAYRDHVIAHDWNVTYPAMRGGWAKAAASSQSSWPRD